MNADKDRAVLRGLQKIDVGQPHRLTVEERQALADNEGTKHLLQYYPLPEPVSPRPRWTRQVGLGDLVVTVEIDVEIGEPRSSTCISTMRLVRP